MSDSLKNTVLRFAIVFVMIALLFIVVFVRIVAIQTVQRDRWESLVDKRESNYKTIKAIRGNIFDCEGRLLASSVPQYSIYMDTRVEALHMNKGELFWSHVDSIAEGLSKIVKDQTKEDYRDQIVKAYRDNKNIRLSNERISYTQLKEIKQLPLIRRGVYKSGFHAEDLNLRVKPFKSLSSRAIGNIYLASGEAKSGLELRFDSYLRGEDGMSVRDKVAGSWQNVPIREAVNGCDLYTTFDANLMDICETALRKRLEYTKADWGCVVMMDVQTGEIKAMSNLDRRADGNYSEVANHAVIRMEPGSTFKTISLMAVLDDGKIDMTDSIEVEKDGWVYYGAKHTDAHPNDTVYSIRQALAVSSNIAVAKIVTIGYDGRAKKFVNKLQILMFYNGIANDGKMIAPLIVREIRKGGKTVEKFESSVIKSSMCDSETLKGIRECLHDVVWDNELGTASINPWGTRKAQSPLVAIAGKTGTAQILEQGYSNRRHRMSFVGYFPEENPQYSCICVIHGPQWPYDAGLDCGTVVRQIAEKTMAYAGEYVIKNGELVMVVKD